MRTCNEKDKFDTEAETDCNISENAQLVAGHSRLRAECCGTLTVHVNEAIRECAAGRTANPSIRFGQ